MWQREPEIIGEGCVGTRADDPSIKKGKERENHTPQ